MDTILRILVGAGSFAIPLICILQWIFRSGWWANIRLVVRVTVLLGVVIAGIEFALTGHL